MLENPANQTDDPILTCEVLLKLREKRMRQERQDFHFQSLHKKKTILVKTLLSCNFLCVHNFIIHWYSQSFDQLMEQKRSELEERLSFLSAQLTALVRYRETDKAAKPRAERITATAPKKANFARPVAVGQMFL